MIVLAPIGYLEAQERTSGASALDVRNRIHPDWNPLGIRAGGFLIHPSVEAATEFDDNIYRHHQNKDSDTIYSIRSRVFGISQWSRHQLQFDASIDSANYAQADGEDTTDWVVGLAGRVDINRNAWIDADLSFQEDHEGRGSPEQQDRTLEPVENTIADLGIKGTYRWNRFSLAVGGRYAEREHENGVKAVVPPPPSTPLNNVSIQDDRDRNERQLSIQAGYDLSPGTEVFVRATDFRRRYDKFEDSEGNKRNSDGSEGVVGFRLDVGALVAAEFFSGYRTQKYKNDPNLPEVDGVTYGLNLTWNPTALSTVRAVASRKAYETALNNTSGYLSSHLNLSVDHELRRNILIGGGVGVTTNKYFGADREDEVVQSNVQAEWKINRNLKTEVGVRVQQRKSNIPENDYDRDSLYLNLRYSL